MPIDTSNLPDDPALLKAMIATLQAENAKISATLRAHDQLVQQGISSTLKMLAAAEVDSSPPMKSGVVRWMAERSPAGLTQFLRHSLTNAQNARYPQNRV